LCPVGWFPASTCQSDDIPHNIDLLSFPSIFFYESGYSIYTLRQASRRSWRIGQKHAVRVAFFTYSDSAQERCLEHATQCYTSLDSINKRV
jgi:hypothetical protein